MLLSSAVRRAAFSRPWMRTFASVGDPVPSIELYKGFPPERVNLAEYCQDKNVILLGLPGAFTPT